ncbi:hypothetical protein [Paraliomyxa miuraensis]|uniref:hypothetical protein n=1 Tax=Paraliomyxa miuraensis TaxID=376150 RepID=UPI00225BC4B7|nr:hypothetical protein [Paraliomyxa miuraensis]MCX4239481.1 hypothetical protein [Paraliomyxa miuraensis]
MKLGQQYQDLDPRRGERVGTVVRLQAHHVTLAWSTAHRTTVARRHLEAGGSRGYVLIADAKTARAPSPTDCMPTTTAQQRARHDQDGVPLWRCLACSAVGRLRPPWRVLLWTQGPWAKRSTVVCSDACHRWVRRGGNG